MTVVTIGDIDAEAGRWRPGKQPDGRRTASMSCPSCGQAASLSDHAIGAEGYVTPSVVCPHAPCTFHDYVQLAGWDERT